MRAQTAEIFASAHRRPAWVKLLTVLLVVFILTMPRALAQPAEESAPLPMPTLHMRLGTGSGELLGPNGKTYLIPEGSHILAPEYWAKEFDGEFLRLQEAETRLTAENKSLRASSSEFHWLPLFVGIVLGSAAGIYVGRKL